MKIRDLFDCIVENLTKEFSVHHTYPGLITIQLESKEEMTIRLLPYATTNELNVFFKKFNDIESPTKEKTMCRVVHIISKTIKELNLFCILTINKMEAVYCHSQSLKKYIIV